MTTEARLADQIIDSVERRILARLGSMAFLEHRFGVVASTGSETINSVSYTTASVYLGGDTTASAGFRVPSGLSLIAGDRVSVVINPAGDRWIDQKF